MDPLRLFVGAKVKAIRKKHKLSQQNLADAVGVAEPTIISIEKGRAATSLDLIEKLALQLGVRPEELFLDNFAQWVVARLSSLDKTQRKFLVRDICSAIGEEVPTDFRFLNEGD